MKRKIIIWCGKILSAIISFLCFFAILQAVLVPKYFNNSTTMADGFYSLEENSLDVLFLGPSQMFNTIDSGKLTYEFGISSYNLGASSQQFSGTKYYLIEALKTQRPKIAMIEISSVFYTDPMRHGGMMEYTFAPMPLTVEKINSIREMSDNDFKTVVFYSFPLFQFHSRWNSLGASDIYYYFRNYDYSARGYFALDHVEQHEIAYKQEFMGDERNMPRENFDLLDDMKAICDKNGVKPIFYKSPNSSWTRMYSKQMKTFFNERQYYFVDFNDYIDEIGIDGNTDLYDDWHLNYKGATKATNFIANYLKTNFFNDGIL